MILCRPEIGTSRPLFMIAVPGVIESESLALCVAEQLGEFARRLDLLLIFKGSFDKANRSSDRSFRGLGMDEGLRILEKVRSETSVPVLTDVHEPAQDAPVAEVVAVLRTSALLARQTDFIAAVAGSGEPANIKKAEFIALRPFRQYAGECHGRLSCSASTGI